MDMFNCDDVATLLTKRKQKFAGSFAGIDSILCELVVVSFYVVTFLCFTVIALHNFNCIHACLLRDF